MIFKDTMEDSDIDDDSDGDSEFTDSQKELLNNFVKTKNSIANLNAQIKLNNNQMNRFIQYDNTI